MGQRSAKLWVQIEPAFSFMKLPTELLFCYFNTLYMAKSLSSCFISRGKEGGGFQAFSTDLLAGYLIDSQDRAECTVVGTD